MSAITSNLPETAESYGKIQRSAGEGRHGICGMPGGLARRHGGGPAVEGNLRQKPGIP